MDDWIRKHLSCSFKYVLNIYSMPCTMLDAGCNGEVPTPLEFTT